MAQPSDNAPEPSVCVIGPQFIAPHPLEVTVERYPCGNLVVTDVNHKILFRVKPHDTKIHSQRLMLNADDEPIVMLRQKKLSVHKRWKAFRGESKDGSNMIFSTKTEHMIRFKTTCVSVILGNESSSNDDCDLKIEGIWKKKNFTVGDSSKTIAQMRKPQTLKKMKSGEDMFMVTIQPNMDYAFVVALFAIVDAMENPVKKQGASAGTVAAGLAVRVISGGLMPPLS